ncbi:hypothetical protein ASG01_01625 [Chryseobacterium sp. Leaf180]|uniref:GDSL-type esterase/lipase family protein n=1 Tax=Chryseobacterium sp. Leaf180 TaxID=1736289 RepID=UPI0006FD1F7D|nr:GDSL-type esterase/lipase family protein [Chryseobacterium sp. Leaf180]KQR94607.1 hypothetical protein ASG01_01625 [Chryseobacterium sp. Leaf180]
MKISKLTAALLFLLLNSQISAQNIENSASLKPFNESLNQKKVTQILFLGDSHIQADYLTAYLRKKLQDKYGNAGRGLVFPSQIANTNGAEDVISATNQTWETYRLVHEQNRFLQLGASGFVIGNNADSFLEIQLKNPEDSFDKVIIFNDQKMNGQPLEVYAETNSLKNFVQKKSERINYQATEGETFHEIVAKNYSTTTKLRQLNGDRILQPKAGSSFLVERNSFTYNPEFEKNIQKLFDAKFTDFKTEISFPTPQQVFLIKSNASGGNLFYGFQFLKNTQKGVVLNSVGVNGATYADFLKFPLQTEQLKTIPTDLLVIALGTNEAFGKTTKEELQNNISALIVKFRAGNPALPVLLIAPPDNLPKNARVVEFISWIKESAEQNNAAFFDLYSATGGKGYFKRAQSRKEASGDGVHYLKPGYEFQAEQIWKAFENVSSNNN